MHTCTAMAVYASVAHDARPVQGVETASKLWFTDLASSERVAQSQATGDHLREAQSINRSLSVLADCVEARCRGHSHIPCRNSKLTHLLQVCRLHLPVHCTCMHWHRCSRVACVLPQHISG